jgi:ComF family protein
MTSFRLLTFAREFLFPAGCAICGQILINSDEAFFGICDHCRKSLSLDNDPRCEICGRPLSSEIKLCTQCRNRETRHLDRLIALFPYTGKYRKILTAFKFDKRVCIGNFLTEKLLEGLALLPEGAPKTPILMPVPPRPGKIKRTGFDQVECLMQKLEKRKNIRVERCLERLPSKPQKELDSKERLTNLVNRIRCRRQPSKEIVLIDDVITTGATMDACATALKNAGTTNVSGICLFFN